MPLSHLKVRARDPTRDRAWQTTSWSHEIAEHNRGSRGNPLGLFGRPGANRQLRPNLPYGECAEPTVMDDRESRPIPCYRGRAHTLPYWARRQFFINGSFKGIWSY
jgi:hypothetical protein